METPTTPTTAKRPAAAAAARASFSSVRMLDAQRAFQCVVKQELQLLLKGGTKREDAVKLLLRRIVASTEPPDATAVRGVMRQFQMNYDDAMRALIVKQELGRLKRQGLDSFAAIEELTRKMRSREDETEQMGGHEQADKAAQNDIGKELDGYEEEAGPMMEEMEQPKDVLSEENEEDKENSTQEQAQEPKKVSAVNQEVKGDKADETIPAAEIASPTSEKDGNETSLSLCQRIGQVSISSGNMAEKKTDGGDNGPELNEDTDREENESVGEMNKAVFKSPLRVRSPLNSNLADLTPQSRKRRAAFGVQYETGSNSRRNSGDRNVKPLFPSLKKQKVCAEVGDGFLEIVTHKSKSMSANQSKAASTAGTSVSSSSGEKGGGSTRSDHSTKNLLKRQRVSSSGMSDSDEYPIAEELHVSHIHHRHHTHHHHSKRQKSGSTH